MLKCIFIRKPGVLRSNGAHTYTHTNQNASKRAIIHAHTLSRHTHAHTHTNTRIHHYASKRVIRMCPRIHESSLSSTNDIIIHRAGQCPLQRQHSRSRCVGEVVLHARVCGCVLSLSLSVCVYVCLCVVVCARVCLCNNAFCWPSIRSYVTLCDKESKTQKKDEETPKNP